MPAMKRLVITGPRMAELEDVPTPDCTDDGLLVRASVTALSTGTEMRPTPESRWTRPDGSFTPTAFR